MALKCILFERVSDVKKFNDIKKIVDNLFNTFKSNLADIIEKNVKFNGDEEDCLNKIFHLKLPNTKIIYLIPSKDIGKKIQGEFSLDENAILLYADELYEIAEEIVQFILDNEDNLKNGISYSFIVKKLKQFYDIIINDKHLLETFVHELTHGFDYLTNSSRKWMKITMKKFNDLLNKVGHVNELFANDYVSIGHEMNAYIMEAVHSMYKLSGGIRISEHPEAFNKVFIESADSLKLSGKVRKTFISRCFVLYSLVTDGEQDINNKIKQVNEII